MFEVSATAPAAVKHALDEKRWLTPRPHSMAADPAAVNASELEARVLNPDAALDVIGHVELLLSLPRKE